MRRGGRRREARSRRQRPSTSWRCWRALSACHCVALPAVAAGEASTRQRCDELANTIQLARLIPAGNERASTTATTTVTVSDATNSHCGRCGCCLVVVAGGRSRHGLRTEGSQRRASGCCRRGWRESSHTGPAERHHTQPPHMQQCPADGSAIHMHNSTLITSQRAAPQWC